MGVKSRVGLGGSPGFTRVDRLRGGFSLGHCLLSF